MNDCAHLVTILRLMDDDGATRIADQIEGRADGVQHDMDDLKAQTQQVIESAGYHRYPWVEPVETIMFQVRFWSVGEPADLVRSDPTVYENMARWAAVQRWLHRYTQKEWDSGVSMNDQAAVVGGLIWTDRIAADLIAETSFARVGEPGEHSLAAAIRFLALERGVPHRDWLHDQWRISAQPVQNILPPVNKTDVMIRSVFRTAALLFLAVVGMLVGGLMLAQSGLPLLWVALGGALCGLVFSIPFLSRRRFFGGLERPSSGDTDMHSAVSYSDPHSNDLVSMRTEG